VPERPSGAPQREAAAAQPRVAVAAQRGEAAAGLPPEAKVVATLAFVVAVVATPPRQVWAFAAYAVLVGLAAGLAGLRPAGFARRLLIEVPFVAFAVLLPFIGVGERVEVLGLSLSVAGLWGAWAILAKGTLGVAAAVVLSATTTPADVLVGLERLRLPRTFVVVAGFMLRYLDLVVAQMRRLQVARVSRGDDARWLWQAKATAATAGTLFVRTYERGERVHLAMLARGFDGSFPAAPSDGTVAVGRRRAWATALALPGLAVAVAAAAWVRA
jgi:cobalt/nickel transport system permease protein